MEFGFVIAPSGWLANPRDAASLARRGEEMGFSYVGVSDHIVMPRHIESRYPYTESGEFPPALFGPWLEQLAVVSFLAGQTSRIRLFTSIMVLPHRGPVYTAKALASIDVLSGGRLTVGCGVGWMREEFDVIGAPPFDERVAVSTEYIQAFKELWTSDTPTFQGKYCRFSDMVFLPKPIQRLHPPIWIGGESPLALRLAARHGNGWFPVGNNPRFPMETPEQYSKALDRLKKYLGEYGRDLSELELVYNAVWYNEREAQLLPNGQRRPFTGSPQQIAGDIRAMGRLGTHLLIVGLRGNSLAETLERMDYFTREVRPLVES